MATPTKNLSREKTLRAVLLIAAFFAIGSTGLLIAVLMERSAPPESTTANVNNQMTTEEKKEALVQFVNASSSNAAATSPSQLASSGRSTSKTQGKQDAQVAARMKLLQFLNAK